MTGMRFGSLTVTRRVGTNKGRYPIWECLCDCGRTVIKTRNTLTANKGTKSCGCLIGEGWAVDFTGKTVGWLTVLASRDIDGSRSGYWTCQCVCGNIVTRKGSQLSTNRAIHCGCQKHDMGFVDLTGKTFGLLTVVKESHIKNGRTHWNCVCECGNQCVKSGSRLQGNGVKSCGCLVSMGENIISNILSTNGIVFHKQKTFPHCVYKNKLKFDFFLPDYGLAIEYDGAQHYWESGWYEKVPLSVIKDRDKTKNEFCFDSGITMLRIPYTEINRIKEILEENLFISLR